MINRLTTYSQHEHKEVGFLDKLADQLFRCVLGILLKQSTLTFLFWLRVDGVRPYLNLSNILRSDSLSYCILSVHRNEAALNSLICVVASEDHERDNAAIVGFAI